MSFILKAHTENMSQFEGHPQLILTRKETCKKRAKSFENQFRLSGLRWKHFNDCSENNATILMCSKDDFR